MGGGIVTVKLNDFYSKLFILPKYFSGAAPYSTTVVGSSLLITVSTPLRKISRSLTFLRFPCYRRKSRYKYKANIPEETSENILNRDFNSSKPNEKWYTDVTEIKIPSTGE